MVAMYSAMKDGPVIQSFGSKKLDTVSQRGAKKQRTENKQSDRESYVAVRCLLATTKCIERNVVLLINIIYYINLTVFVCLQVFCFEVEVQRPFFRNLGLL